jgi:hypothetical protein
MAVGGVDGVDLGGGVELDVVGGVEPVLVQVEAVAVGLAAQVGLGQGRAVVGPFGFVAEQQQAAAEALGAQGLGRFGAGQAGTEDHENGTDGHRSSLVAGDLVAVRRRWTSAVSWVGFSIESVSLL